MNKRLSDEQLETLRSIDTPTICNAIERINVRGRVEGFLGMDLRCLLPELGTLVGYAVPVMVDSTTPDVPQDPQVWLEWLRAMEAAPKPGVLVFQDIGPQPRKSAHFGEVMGTISKRLGVAGIVTDGGIRDLLELQRLRFHCFAAGLVPSHGNPRLVGVGGPVVIDGVTIHPGDLLHGDVNGVTTIPDNVVLQLPEVVEQVRREEARTMDYVNGAEFSVEGLYDLKYGH